MNKGRSYRLLEAIILVVGISGIWVNGAAAVAQTSSEGKRATPAQAMPAQVQAPVQSQSASQPQSPEQPQAAASAVPPY